MLLDLSNYVVNMRVGLIKPDNNAPFEMIRAPFLRVDQLIRDVLKEMTP